MRFGYRSHPWTGAGVILLGVALLALLGACGVSTTGGVGTGGAANSTTGTGTATSPPGTATASARPTAACPAPPAGAASGPLLYWTGVAGHIPPSPEHPARLCAVGFHAGEHVTLTIVNSANTTSGTLPAADADGGGAFTLTVSQASPPSCTGGVLSVHAQGDKGSAAGVALPGGPPTGCPPA